MPQPLSTHHLLLVLLLTSGGLLSAVSLNTHSLERGSQAESQQNTDELAARTINQLSYVAADYPQAVSSGALVDPQLFTQLQRHAQGAAALLMQLPDKPGRAQLARSLEELIAAIEKREDSERVRRRANAVADRLAALYQLPRSPAEVLPTAEEGRDLYRQRCSQCHGAAGEPVAGTAVAADFSNRRRMAGFSLYDIYNAIDPSRDDIHGQRIDGDLSSRQRWALAVLVAGFAAPPRMPPAGLAERYPALVVQPGVATVRPSALPLDARQALLWWRAYPQKARELQHPLTRAAGLLQQAQTAYRGGDIAAAYHQLMLAQREGYDPARAQLESRNAALATQLDQQWRNLRQKILEQGPENEIIEGFQALTATVIRARDQLQPPSHRWSYGWAALLFAAAAAVGWLLWVKLLRPRRR